MGDDMSDECELSMMYNGTNGKYSCQPFFLSLLPGKTIKLDKLLSELKGVLRTESVTVGSNVVISEFLDKDGNLRKKMEITDTQLINQNSGIMLTTHETESTVHFRGHNYLFLKTNFIFTKIEYIEDTYYLYVFANENSIKDYIKVLGARVEDLGLNIGDFSLSKTALAELRQVLGGELKEFGLSNVTSRLKSVRGKGNDLQNDDTFNELKGKPNAEVYHYLVQIDEPHRDLNLEKLTVSIRNNCFVHSYHHITYDALLWFVRTYIIPQATAKIFSRHPLSAYNELEIYEDYPDVEQS